MAKKRDVKFQHGGASVLSVVLLLGLPFVSPFAVGTSPGSPSLFKVKPPLKGIRKARGASVALSSTEIQENPLVSSADEVHVSGGEHNATWPSRLLFRYTSPLLDLASKRQLDENDAFTVPEEKRMGSSVPKLEHIYKDRMKKARKRILLQENVPKAKVSKSVQLVKSLVKQQRQMLITTGVLRLVNTAVQAFPAVLVARLLRLVESPEDNASKAIGAAISLIAVLLVKMIVENQYFHNVVKFSTQVRGSLAGLVFDKSQHLPSGGGGVEEASSSSNEKGKKKKKKSKKNKSLAAGEVINLMQSDASIIENAAMQIHTLWDGPLQIAVYTSLLYKYMGRSVLWGIGVLLMVIPLNSITLTLLTRLTILENDAKDARTKRTTESIANMKLLKLQAWEDTFADDIRGHRKDELGRHEHRGVIRALNSAISNAVPALTLVVTLAAYARTGKPIVASTIFTAISLFNQLRFPLFFYPNLIDSLARGKQAIQRISSYLDSEEITPYVEKLPLIDGEGGGVEIKNGNFMWSSSTGPLREGESSTSSSPALCDVDLKVKPGEVVAVIGTVGSGKTALIKSILGELSSVPRMVVDQSVSSKSEGTVADASPSDTPGIMDVPLVATNGDVAYCSQEAWLPKGTIREAVVFGRDYDEERYLSALRDAGLDEDIVDDSAGGIGSKSAASSGVLTHNTDVGEGGSSLSGGQRARVALARALYASDATKVFLLDDPLAALDASVGSKVFERITKRLRKSKAATLLVTNDPSLPRRCDRVVLMGKYSPASPSCSTIVDTGTYEQLINRGHDVRSIVSHTFEEDEEDDEESEESSDEETEILIEPMIEQREKIRVVKGNTIRVVGGYEVPLNETDCCHADPDSQACMEYIPDYIPENEDPPELRKDDPCLPMKADHQVTMVANEETASEEEAPREKGTESVVETRGEKKLTSADDAMSTGAVPASTYLTYIKSVGSPVLIAGMILSYLFANGAQFFQQYIVAKWTEIGKVDAMATALGARYLRQLVNAAGVVSVFLWLRSYLTMRVGVRASKFLHNRMLRSVFAAPISFFDATPSGQLLSRFGKELETVDRSLPDNTGSVLFCILQISSSFLALAGVITPAMLLPLSLIGVLYFSTMSRFRPAARDFKRAESKSRSPIYTHFGEALRGTEIIRSVPGAKANWSRQHRELTDQNLSVYYAVKALDRWLSIRLETLGNAVVFAAAIASVFLTRAGRLKAGSAGWGLTQALSITGLLTWAVRTFTDLETSMMSVLRVKELTDLDSDEVDGISEGSNSIRETRMPKEMSSAGSALNAIYSNVTPMNVTLAPLNDTALVNDGWPWKGGIRFNKVSMRYNPVSPLVLKDVSINVPPGTTLGVVGRTGSGKSSLLLTLFRLVELEPSGSIEIDGVDIRSVSLQTLRESLAIIPQDPVLFAGTIMSNLDATGKSTREDAWEALEAASPDLAKQFRSAGTGLDTVVAEGGKNLSVGQRQLLCLARALLRKSKILVLDEATSSVDSKTDAAVQETIRREFVDKGVTVITVAHRLETVLGYDKIAVLGSGELLEYGQPAALLRNRNGELRRLVEADRQNKKKGAAMTTSGTNTTSTPVAVA